MGNAVPTTQQRGGNVYDIYTVLRALNAHEYKLPKNRLPLSHPLAYSQPVILGSGKFMRPVAPRPSRISFSLESGALSPRYGLGIPHYSRRRFHTNCIIVGRTVKCETLEGPCVVKIYANYGASGGKLEEYSDLLARAARRLHRQPNVLPYARAVEAGGTACLVRQYFRFTLRSRLSSRPFLTPLEKRWVAFLLLHAVRQLHEQNVVHGDIKSENVVCTSWGWYLLTDFACFKPPHLPGNDPAAFHFFFESRGRRRCYLAPERFQYGAGGNTHVVGGVRAPSTGGGAEGAGTGRRGERGARTPHDGAGGAGSGSVPLPSATRPVTRSTDMFLDAMMDRNRTPADADEEMGEKGNYAAAAGAATSQPRSLTRAMDVFSMGCVIAELFLDGEALFGLSDMLKYSKEERRGASVNDTFPPHLDRGFHPPHKGRGGVRKGGGIASGATESGVAHGGRTFTDNARKPPPSPARTSKKGLVGVAAALAKLAAADRRAYDLVVHMLQRDPRRRRCAREYIRCHSQAVPGAAAACGKAAESSLLFPAYFSNFLFGFMSSLLHGPRASPDERVRAICENYGAILHHLADGLVDVAGETLFRQRLRLMGRSSTCDKARTHEVTGSTERLRRNLDCHRLPAINSPPPQQNAIEGEEMESLVADVDALVGDLVSDRYAHVKASSPSVVTARLSTTPAKLGVRASVGNSGGANDGGNTSNADTRVASRGNARVSSVPPASATLPRGQACMQSSCAVVGVPEGDGNGLIIIVGLLSETLRLVRSPQTKLTALWLMARFAEIGGGDAIRLQRVVPVLVSLISDSATVVRAEAIRAMTRVLRLVRAFPPSDFNVFPEYIFPAIHRLPNDPNELVRLAFAECIPLLAETSCEYLERKMLTSRAHRKQEARQRRQRRQRQRREGRDRHQVQEKQGRRLRQRARRERWQKRQLVLQTRRKREFGVLREEIEKALARMVAQVPVCSSLVKRTLLCGVTRLCTFFGQDRTNDFLLPLLITFLNEHGDWQLRATFFERISGVSLFVGKVSLHQFLLPCIEPQALQDPEDIVVGRALRCLSSLCELGLLGKSHFFDLAEKVCPLLFHPGTWIRRGAVHYLTAIASIRLDPSHISYADVQSVLLPALAPFFYSMTPGVYRSLLLVGFAKTQKHLYRCIGPDVPWSTGTSCDGDDFTASPDALFWSLLKSPLTREQFGTAHRIVRKRFDEVAAKAHTRLRNRAAGMCRYLIRVGGGGLQRPRPKPRTVKVRSANNGGPGKGRESAATRVAMPHNTHGAALVVPSFAAEEADAGWLVAELGDLHFGPAHALVCCIAGYRESLFEVHGMFRSAVDVTNLVHRGKEQVPCFAGSIAVDALLKNGAAHTRNHAVALGNLLVDAGLLCSVAGKHAFKDGHFYFRFSTDIPPVQTAPRISSAANGEHCRVVDAPEEHQHHVSVISTPALLSPPQRPQVIEGWGTALRDSAHREFHSTINEGGRNGPCSNVVGGNAPALGLPPLSSTESSNVADSLPSAIGLLHGTRPTTVPQAERSTQSNPAASMQPSLSQNVSAVPTQNALKGSHRPPNRKMWRPRGVLMTQLFEHTGAVVAIAVAEDNAWFATGAHDGVVKVWKGSGLDREVAVASQFTFTPDGGPVGDVAVCANAHSLAVGSQDGAVHVVRVDHGSVSGRPSSRRPLIGRPAADSRSRSRVHVPCSQVVPPAERVERGGGVVAVSYFNSITRSLLCYATQQGGIHGWDARARREAWGLKVPQSVGDMTSMAVASDNQWFVCGTARGFLALYDARFPLLVRLWRHGSHAKVHSVKTTCLYSSNPVAYVATAAGNECDLWNLETGRCERVYRSLPPSCSQAVALLCPHLERFPNFPRSFDASRRRSAVGSVGHAFNCRPCPQYGVPNMNPPANEPSVRAILCPMSEPQLHGSSSPGSSLISAGSDCHIRFWDVAQPRKSYTMSGLLANQSSPSYDLAYARVWSAPRKAGTDCNVPGKLVRRSQWRRPNELCLCQDALVPTHDAPAKGSGGPIPASTNHADAVTALGGISLPSMRLLISGGRDGVVKVWR